MARFPVVDEPLLDRGRYLKGKKWGSSIKKKFLKEFSDALKVCGIRQSFTNTSPHLLSLKKNLMSITKLYQNLATLSGKRQIPVIENDP